MYIHYYTQNKIKEILSSLIKDIKQLLKNIYKHKETDKINFKNIYL